MTSRPHLARLAPGDHAFNGTEIDRARPLRFRLNGQIIGGFAGDSVLSATLAAGIAAIGQYEGTSLALGERLCPPIVAAGTRDTARAMPMDRTPAIDGAEWQTVGFGFRPSGLAALLADKSSLGLRSLSERRTLRPWLDAPAATTSACDLVIVGGGVAGMSAAVAAGKLGMHVALIERQARLGGSGAMFGTLDGEESFADAVHRLTSEIAALSNISVFCRAEAYAVRPGRVELHLVEVDGTALKSRSVALTAKAIILATGAQERLPVFSGNRLPGVTTAVAAYELARRFAVWPGTTAVLATAASAPYRLATQAYDAGITFPRLVDVRANPQSRFIEFTKAYGLTQVSGTRVQAVTRSKRGLEIDLILEHASLESESTRLQADRLLVSGGFQPALSLWLNAGGAARWSPKHYRLEAGAGQAGITLAGSAAGWLSRKACQQSGVDAVKALFKRKRQPVADLAIDAIYETPDAPTPVHFSPGGYPAFLDDGDSLIAAPATVARPARRKAEPWQLADAAQAFGLNDVAAAVQLGAIAPVEAGPVALERTSLSVNLSALAAEAALQPDREPPLVPKYLASRFGADAVVWEIAADQGRMLETGSLIFVNSDQTNPLHAIGVVVGQPKAASLGLIASRYATPDHGVTVRDQGQAISAKLVAPSPAAPSDAPLGGSPGAP